MSDHDSAFQPLTPYLRYPDGAGAGEDKPYGPRTVTVTDPWGVTWDFWQGEAVL